MHEIIKFDSSELVVTGHTSEVRISILCIILTPHLNVGLTFPALGPPAQQGRIHSSISEEAAIVPC